MTRQRRPNSAEVRALIRRPDDHYLLVRSASDADGPWEFPGGPFAPPAAPDDTLRRLCEASLGLCLDLMIAQPPYRYGLGPRQITYHYYFCPVERDEALPLGCADLLWVPHTALARQAVAPPAWPVVQRLLEGANDP